MKRFDNVFIALLLIVSVLLFSGCGNPTGGGGDGGSSPITSSWQYIGPAGFTPGAANYLSLYVYSGTPYIAYSDGSNKQIVMKYNSAGNTWEAVGSPEGFATVSGNESYKSIYVYQGVPYVAFSDATLSQNKATVMRYESTGNTWEVVGNPRFSAGGVNFIVLCFDGATPEVAYRDGGNSNYATVMRYNSATNLWNTYGSAGFSSQTVTHTSLFAYDGITYVAFYDEFNGKLRVMRNSGGGWFNVGSGIGISDGPVKYNSLFVANGTLEVAYEDLYNNDKLTVLQFNGSSWDPIGSVGISAATAEYPSLVINNGSPEVAFRDFACGGKTTVLRWNSVTWEAVGARGVSHDDSYYVNLCLDNGTRWLGYSVGPGGSKASVMKYVP